MTRDVITVFDPHRAIPAVSLNQNNGWIHIESQSQARHVIDEIAAKMGALPDD